jgi:hypothetical protein
MSSSLADQGRHPLVSRIKGKKRFAASLAQQKQQHRDVQQKRLVVRREERRSEMIFSIAVSVGGAHECVVELSV